MSALPPKATSNATYGMSAKGQKRTFRHSFDYSVGGYEQTGRHGQDISEPRNERAHFPRPDTRFTGPNGPPPCCQATVALRSCNQIAVDVLPAHANCVAARRCAV